MYNDVPRQGKGVSAASECRLSSYASWLQALCVLRLTKPLDITYMGLKLLSMRVIVVELYYHLRQAYIVRLLCDQRAFDRPLYRPSAFLPPSTIQMTTITETSERSLQLRPEPLRLRSGYKRHGIVAASPSPLWSGATTLESLAQDVEKFDEQLPPVDGGIAAWRFLFAAFVVEAFIFGRMNHYIYKSSKLMR